MKIQYRIALLLIVILPVLNSCKKTFLELNPYDGFPVDGAIKSEADLNTAVNGMYSGMTSSSLYGRLLPVRGDLVADNVYLKTGNSGRYLTFRDLNPTVANSDALNLWTVSYDIIKRANTVINADIPGSVNVDQLKGEAYAIRALIHFELLRNFATPYTVDQNALGIPIVTEFDLTSKPTRSTVKEVYTQIIADLNKAYTMITLNQGDDLFISATNFTRPISSHFVSKFAAKALLARAYQAMGDWTNARDAALDVVNNSGFSLVSKAGYIGFWANPGDRTDRTETLFEVEVDAATNAGTNSLSNFYSLTGYGDLFTPDEFYNSYAGTDIRKNIILVNTTAQPGKTVYINNKYSNNTNPDDKDNIKVIRYADVLLILAEAYANLNDEPNARLRLNQVAQTRDDAFGGYASTGATLKADIINERRKELAFEGQRYYDFLRLNLPVTNHLKSQSPLVVFPIPITEPKRLLPIPQSELDANENLRSQQNPGY